MNNQKVSYLLDITIRYFSDHRCPFCRSSSVKVIDRKFWVSRLFECNSCHLYFRHPKDKEGFNKKFYQETYDEPGLTTNIPDASALEQYKRDNFIGTNKDFTDRIQVINALLPGRKISVVDYGTSWGYASYQFKNAGFDVQSFEISRPMAEKGSKLLELDIKYKVEDLRSGNDVFFSSHVIEHLSDINFLLDTGRRLLKKEGLFIAYSPNGSRPFREKQPDIFTALWGMVHPNFLNADFYSTILKDHPFVITSNPYDNISLFSDWNQSSQIVGDLSGDELLLICALNKT